MGFDRDLVLSDERHYGAFVCAICQNLIDLDALVTTACSHCFCKQCLPMWLEKATTCPTCNRDLLYSSNNDKKQASMMMGSHTVLVLPLEDSQPLAHRLLKTILVECPLRKGVPCQWKGDYGDLQTHLLSSTAHNTSSSSSTTATTTTTVPMMEDDSESESEAKRQRQQEKQQSLAASLKEEANSRFESKHYQEAKSLYTKAIEVLKSDLPESALASSAAPPPLLATLYSNRAATHLELQDYSLCLDDCQYVLQRLDPTNPKAYVRASRAAIQLGELERSLRFLQQGLLHHPQHSALQKDHTNVQRLMAMNSQGQEQLQSQQQYAAAKATFGTLLKESPSAVPFLLGAAQADLGLGLVDSAVRLTKRVLINHAQNPYGCWVRGQAVFLMGDAKIGIQLLQEALRLDPDSQPIKQSFKMAKKVQGWMETAQRKIFSRQFLEAIDLLTSCIQHYQPLPPKCPFYATLYTQRAETHLRVKQYKEALKDCALVLYAQEDHIPAWLIRFQAHHGLEDHATALDEVKEVCRKFNLEQDHRLRQAYERADFLLRKQRRVDFYQLMGISSLASEMEIKKAYKRKALQLHPDKLPPGSSVEEQKQGQRRFQQLGEGLEILCDDFQRRLYDEGYDPEAIRERLEAAKQAAHNHRGHHHHY
jgi:DnaJ family protein C protein 7